MTPLSLSFRLETKVRLLRSENESLRQSSSASIRTSHSTSPTPASITSYSDKYPLQDHHTHNKPTQVSIVFYHTSLEDRKP